MAVAISITCIDPTENGVVVEGTFTLTGNYGGAATHGDTVNFAAVPQIPSNAVPRGLVDIGENPPAGTAPNGYIFNYCPGTTMANGVMTITNNLTEYTQGSAYSAGLLAAVISFRAIFSYGVGNSVSPI